MALMVQEHGNIPGQARNLVVTGDNLTWKGSDFNSMWVITFTKNADGSIQAVLSKEREWLKSSAFCKYYI